jgi:CRISPR-associated RAMP protein (TIGR02581 family)
MSGIDLRPRSHGALERLVLFDFRLTCRTGLHIGAGKSADLAGSDLPVLRDAAGRPLVPGSSLRGILRSGIEAICLSLRLDEARSLADAGPSDPPGEFAQKWREMTLVERLFGRVAEKRGAFSYGSRLQISDAVVNTDVAVELRDGVGIDRETRTAGTGVKFDLEVIPAGTRFAGKIRFKNPIDYEIGLLAQALWMLNEGGLLLGGKSARGLGWVEVEVSAPWQLDAKGLLAGSSPTASGPEWGPVDKHFKTELESLRELSDAASKLVA